jgi:peptidoglycan/LPS O-acetylase OafA/YrhL
MNPEAPKRFLSIGDLSDGRYNNFDFMRFLLALSVIFSHSFAFLYNPTWYGFDPLLHLTNGQAGFGGSAVDGFFLISGFLVTQSWANTRDLGAFVAKRALRIVPALAVVLAFCTFVVGPLAVQDIGSYFHNPGTYRFLALMFAKRIDVSDVLPGVFVHNPEPRDVDGSLWTIRYELGCYGIVAAFGLLGLYKRPASVVGLAIVSFVLKALHIFGIHSFGLFDNLFHLLTYFSVGMLFYLYRARIAHSPVLLIGSILVLVLSAFVKLLPLTMPIFFGYLIFYVAFSNKIRLQRFAKHGDISYGMYLYACPIQQLLVFYLPRSFNAGTLFLTATLLTALCAALSWRFVEEPALRLKPRRRLPEIDPHVAHSVSPVASAGAGR